MGEGDSTKVPGSDPSNWETIYSKFSSVFEKTGTPPPRIIEYKIHLVLDSVPPAKRCYRMSPVELAEVRKQLDKYLSKGWIIPSTSPYRVLILFAGMEDGTLRMYIDYRALNQ